MVHVTLFGRIYEVDLRSPHTSPRYRCEGRWMRDPWLSNQDVLFDPAALAVTRGRVKTLPPDRVGVA